MDNANRELDEMKGDCERLRTMLEEEKKQRNIAEEAWKVSMRIMIKIYQGIHMFGIPGRFDLITVNTITSHNID